MGRKNAQLLESDAREKHSRHALKVQDVPKNQWRHMHRVSIVRHAFSFWWMLGVLLFAIVQNMMSQIDVRELQHMVAKVGSIPAFVLLLVVSGLLIVTLVALGVGVMVWRHTTYALAQSGVHFRFGVLFKRHIHIGWDRIQSVEIQQSFLARIIGFGTVTIESAGQQKDIKLGLLQMRQAAMLRQRILAQVNKVRSCVDAPADAAMHEQSALAGEEIMLDIDDLERDHLIYELPLRRYILSRLLSGQVLFALIYCMAIIVATMIAAFGFGAGIKALPLLSALTLGAAMMGTVLTGVLRDFGTKIYISPTGIRHRSGATKISTVNYPPDRIHAISIKRRWLWRACDWWEVQILKAGIAGSADLEDFRRIFVPIATRQEMLRILWVLLPGLGTGEDAAVLSEAMDGQGTSVWFTGSPSSARLVSPISWKGNGVCVVPQALLVRSGRFSRTVIVAPHDHIQSLHILQGPIAGFLGLAHLRADCVPGAITVAARELDARMCQEIFYQENTTARRARKMRVSESLAQWKARTLGNNA